jgi:nitroreductase
MHTHDALLTRRTVQRYTGEPVPDDVIDRAIAAAHMAPCHKLTWPWRFTLLGPEATEATVQLAISMKAARRKTAVSLADVERGVRAKLGSAGRLIAVSQVLDDDAFRREEDYAAVACAIQNLSLSLHADGFGSKWSTGGFTRHPDTYERLGIDPEQERIVGIVLVGVPVAAPTAPPRPELPHVVRRVD